MPIGDVPSQCYYSTRFLISLCIRRHLVFSNVRFFSFDSNQLNFRYVLILRANDIKIDIGNDNDNGNSNRNKYNNNCKITSPFKAKSYLEEDCESITTQTQPQ